MTYFATNLFALLEEFFGQYWVEVTFALTLVMLFVLCVLCIYISSKNKKMRKELTALQTTNTNLKQQVEDLESTLSYVKTNFEKRLAASNDKEIELNAVIEIKNQEIEELTKKVKRSEAAKKAAETRRKNKETK